MAGLDPAIHGRRLGWCGFRGYLDQIRSSLGMMNFCVG
jgi:hypothetical protein